MDIGHVLIHVTHYAPPTDMDSIFLASRQLWVGKSMIKDIAVVTTDFIPGIMLLVCSSVEVNKQHAVIVGLGLKLGFVGALATD